MAITRLERLFNLTAALLDTPVPLTAEMVRDRVAGYGPEGSHEAFIRKFERDKKTLREMGVEIAVLEAPYDDPPVDGYRILAEDYYLPDPGLTNDELAALHLASRIINFDPSGSVSGIWKLGGVPEHTPGVSAAESIASLPTNPNLLVVFQAAISGRAVRFEYHDAVREVTDVRLGLRRGNWYLIGVDVAASEGRRFRLDRIQGSVTAVDEPAETVEASNGIRVDLDGLDPWRIGNHEPLTARVAVDHAIAAMVIHEVGEDRVVVRHDSGDIEIELEVTNPDGFRSWVLGMQERAQVLAPASLVRSVTDWLESLAGELA